MVQIGNDVWMSGWNRCDVIIENTLIMITRFWHDVKSLCLVSTFTIIRANVKKIHWRWYLFFARTYLITTMSSLFSNAVFMSSWHMKFSFHFFQYKKYKQNILKCNWISDSQIWTRNYELISISSCESDSIFVLFYTLQSIRNLICYCSWWHLRT